MPTAVPSHVGCTVVVEISPAGVVHCHEYEGDAGDGWVAHGEPGEIVDDLFREQSTEVAQEHEQDGTVRGQLAEGPGGSEPDTVDREIEHGIGE